MTNTILQVALSAAVLAQTQSQLDIPPPLDVDAAQPDPDQKTGTVDGYLQWPTPTQTAVVLRTLCPPTCTVDEALRIASATYDVSYARLACLARLESTNNPSATNGRYMGLLQFDQQTWNLTPYAPYSPFNAWASANAAAYLIARGEGRRWPPLARC